MTERTRDWDMEELKAALHRGGPPTDDDVSITWDGRRLDSKEAVLAFIDELYRE